MDAASVTQKVLWSLIGAGGLWTACILLCTSTGVHRQAFHAHKIPIWWGQQLDKPETFGFLENQIIPFLISTKDEHRLYAWPVTPLQIYARYESTILHDSAQVYGDVRARVAFTAADRSSKKSSDNLLPRNAGTVGQTRRTDACRMISSGTSIPV